MRFWLALLLVAGVGISGCCSRRPATEFNRFDGTANQPTGFCGIFAGFGTTDEPERWGALYTPITVEEYGELLCGRLDPADYATCVNRTWAHYRQAQRQPNLPGESTSGPFAVVVGNEILLGTYWSQPFAAHFRVSNERLVCQGGYDAFAGDTQAVFQVRCNNGLKGKAQMVRDRNGRNGIGGIYMKNKVQAKLIRNYLPKFFSFEEKMKYHAESLIAVDSDSGLYRVTLFNGKTYELKESLFHNPDFSRIFGEDADEMPIL